MFILNRRKEPTPLDIAIDEAIDELKSHSPFSTEYTQSVTNINILMTQQAAKAPKGVSPDVWVTTAAYLLAIWGTLKHEKLDIITTKAWSMLGRGLR